MSSLSLAYLMPALPEIFMALSGLGLLVVGVFLGNGGTRTISWSVAASFAVAALLLLGLDWDRIETFNGMFVLDRFTGFMKLFVLVGLITSVMISVRFLYQVQIARFEYPVLMLFAGLGMMIMISANNMLVLYMGLELQSLALYVLAAFRRDQNRAAEAGIKYFILGALASGMLLFGTSMIYGYTGSIDFDVIGQTLANNPVADTGLIVGLVFVLVSMAFKVSAVPFHMWTPDVYEGAPTSVTAFFAIVPKLAAMAILVRVLYGPFMSISADWQQIIWFMAAASLIVSSFAGLAQKNIKRLMAYSSIGNMGYALIGVAAGTQVGVGAVVLYMIIYMIMTAGVFSVILMMRRNGIGAEDIEDLSGLSTNSPLLAAALAILLFSMAGIPPMAGFFGKLLIFNAAVSAGMFNLAVLGVLASVVAAFYYLRIIKVMYFDEAVDPFDQQIAFSKRAVLLLSVLFITLFILKPDALIATSMSAAAALFTG
ncbi:MAG: NADH-quinone oxidoreductase subunit NuoN [Pseudomonadota bacterium]|nr:NADH-quinone oxidoreductase subunit NuoN [Pseudomonadota bacterium]